MSTSSDSKADPAPPSVGEEEVPLSKAFALLADEEYQDVWLEGTDGVRVPANRMALMVRSEYFKKMFQQKKGGVSFQEATKEVVSIGFTSEVLRAIVEYIHTDTTGLLASKPNSNNNNKLLATQQFEAFQSLLSLTEAGMYVGLPGLCHMAQKSLGLYMNAYPSLAFSLVAASKREGPVISQALEDQAWSICMRKTGVLSEIVLGAMDCSMLATVLCDERMKYDDSMIFYLLDCWSKSEPHHTNNETVQSRQESARELLQQHVVLEYMDPDELSDLVAPSGLVTERQLLNAFSWQAKKAKHEHSVFFQRRSELDPAVTWTSSKSKVCTADGYWKSDKLSMPPIVLGAKHQWTVQIADNTRGVWLGMAKSSHELDTEEVCGGQSHCWGLTGHGYEWSNGTAFRGQFLGEDAQFGDGSRVTMTLDLSENEPANGTLSISVNDGPTVKAISDLRWRLDGSSAGFVPAVSFDEGTITVLDVDVPYSKCLG